MPPTSWAGVYCCSLQDDWHRETALWAVNCATLWLHAPVSWVSLHLGPWKESSTAQRALRPHHSPRHFDSSARLRLLQSTLEVCTHKSSRTHTLPALFCPLAKLASNTDRTSQDICNNKWKSSVTTPSNGGPYYTTSFIHTHTHTQDRNREREREKTKVFCQAKDECFRSLLGFGKADCMLELFDSNYGRDDDNTARRIQPWSNMTKTQPRRQKS